MTTFGLNTSLNTFWHRLKEAHTQGTWYGAPDLVKGTFQLCQVGVLCVEQLFVDPVSNGLDRIQVRATGRPFHHFYVVVCEPSLANIGFVARRIVLLEGY